MKCRAMSWACYELVRDELSHYELSCDELSAMSCRVTIPKVSRIFLSLSQLQRQLPDDHSGRIATKDGQS